MRVWIRLHDGIILVGVNRDFAPRDHNSLEHVLGLALVRILQHLILAKKLIKLLF